MKNKTILGFVLFALLLAACGGQSPTQPEAAAATATSTSEPSITPTFEPTAAPTPTVGPTPAGGSNRIVFGLQQRVGEGYEDLGVYLFDLNTQQLTQIAPAGWNLQDVSYDGSSLLINKGQELYISNWDGTSPRVFASNLYNFGRTSATFLSGAIAYIGGTEDGTAVFLQSLDGSQAQIIVPSNGRPIEVIPSITGDLIYWDSGTCTGEGVCTVEQTWVGTLDGSATLLPGMFKPHLSPNGASLAYSYLNEDGKSNLAWEDTSQNPVNIPIQLPGDILADFTWSPDSASLAVIRLDRSDYDGKVSGTRIFLYDIDTAVLTELPEVAGLNNRVLWSPDGTYLAFTATELTDTGSRILLDVVRVSDRSLISYSNSVNLASSNFLVITNVYWLTLP